MVIDEHQPTNRGHNQWLVVSHRQHGGEIHRRGGVVAVVSTKGALRIAKQTGQDQRNCGAGRDEPSDDPHTANTSTVVSGVAHSIRPGPSGDSLGACLGPALGRCRLSLLWPCRPAGRRPAWASIPVATPIAIPPSIAPVRPLRRLVRPTAASRPTSRETSFKPTAVFAPTKCASGGRRARWWSMNPRSSSSGLAHRRCLLASSVKWPSARSFCSRTSPRAARASIRRLPAPRSLLPSASRSASARSIPRSSFCSTSQRMSWPRET